MSSSRNSGFTLLEMLVAIGIFAMLGLAANAVLQTVIKDDEVTQDFAKQLKGLQQGFGTIERDMGQMVARTPRSVQGGRASTVIQSGKDMLESESEALVFFRLGWLNPAGILPRGSLQFVAYVVKDSKLERWFYPYPEPEVGAEPIKTVLMDKVVSVKYAFNVDGKWQQGGTYTKLPDAVAIEVELEDRGVIKREFLLPKGASSTSSSDDDSSNTQESSVSSDSEDDSTDSTSSTEE